MMSREPEVKVTYFPIYGGNGVTVRDLRVTVDGRPLVVIDPEDRKQVHALADAFCRERWDHTPGSTECDPLTFSSMQAALRSLIEPPKPYREHDGPVTPWPEVNECHSSSLPDHECPQCAWEHQHDWVAWDRGGNRSEIPIRCSKCGGRKCDFDECDQQRHTHVHFAEVIQ